MRLINCLVENVRVHSNLSIDFSPKITLIGGANETGKSSLIDALHRTLFLKATASGAPIEALRSKLYLGHPTVQIKFEVKDENYILRKNFSGANGQVMLSNEVNGKQLSGAIAEEYLAILLGVSRTTVRARIDRLQKLGEILGFSVVLNDDTKVDPLRGYMMINVEGHGTERFIRLLHGLPQVRAVHATNGQWDLIAEIGTDSLDELDEILTQIRRFEGVAKSETNLLLSTKKGG